MRDYPKNIKRWELLHSDTAIREGIDNTPPDEIECNVLRMAEWLQVLREGIGSPIYISSGYRSPELNKRVRGSSRSIHMIGLAADFVVPRVSVRELTSFIQATVGKYDQLIAEHDRWVHVALPMDNTSPRLQVLHAYKKDGVTVYGEFL